MPVLVVDRLTKYFGADRVLESVSFALDRQDRAGLVGRNGGGKSTLLAVISGDLEPDEGSVTIATGVKIGRLTQDPQYDPSRSLWDEVSRAFEVIRAMEARLRQLEAEISQASQLGQRVDEMLSRYARAEEEFSMAGGYQWQVKQASVLTGLGFSPEEFGKQMCTLSSGQRIRAALASVLLQEPDLLLLDEPTNHLDVDAAEWLEERLRTFPGAVITVSHDRFFLNAVCTKTFELENNMLSEYTGNYDAYIVQREARREVQVKEHERYLKRADSLKHYIQRYQAGNRATMAKSREKWLARLSPVLPPKKSKNISIGFRKGPELAREVFRVKHLSAGYGGHQVISGASFRIMASDRIGVIGKNGAGKTTLLKVLMGFIKPMSGSVWIGPSATIGYFWQDLDALTLTNDVLGELMDGTDLLPGEARNILGRFLFSGDDVKKSVSVLSGGERSRLTLAKLVVSGCNVLVLDEPTNHLDVEGKQALASALVDFGGCVLFVTHDRQFLEDVATRIFEVTEESLNIYDGNYSSYREQKRIRMEASQQAQIEKPATQQAEAATKSVRKGTGDPIRRELQRKAHQKAIDRVQEEIERLEAERDEVLSRLSDPETYRSGESIAIVSRHKQIEESIKSKYQEWETLEKNTPG